MLDFHLVRVVLIAHVRDALAAIGLQRTRVTFTASRDVIAAGAYRSNANRAPRCWRHPTGLLSRTAL